MEAGHSRLLKFLLPNNLLNMSKQHELRVEYVRAPSCVESEVPGQQRMRQLIHGDVSTDQHNNDQQDDAKNDDSTLVPVFKMKIEEAAFTKGDLKLQKVSVTENVSDNHDKAAIPLTSEVHSGIIEDHQPLKSDDDSEAKKPRSRIPKLRQVAEKFKQDRREDKEKGISTRRPRRSSIPKLKRIKTPSSKGYDISTEDTAQSTTQVKNNIQPVTNTDSNDNIPPEEQFDKIFDEIIHDDVESVLDTNVLVENFEDAEKLAYSFEEIVHDYEENKIQPIDVKQIKNKVLLVKQKSLPEEKFSRKLERRRSLKDVPKDVDNSFDGKAGENVNKIDNKKKKVNRKSKKENDVNPEVAKPNVAEELKTINTNTEFISTQLQNEMAKEMNERIKIVTPVFESQQQIVSKNNSEIDEQSKQIAVKHVSKLHSHEENVGETHESYEIIVEPKPKDNDSKDNSKPDISPTVLKIICENQLNRDISTNDLSLVINEHVIEKVEQSKGTIPQDKGFSNKTASSIEANNNLDEENTRNSLLITSNIYQNPANKLKFENYESIPTELKFNSTPPNTPQVHENEPYKDSAHLAGKPKILNIDHECEIEENVVSVKHKRENEIQTSIEPNVPNQRSSNFELIKQHKISKHTKKSARDVYNQYEYDRSQSINLDSPNPDDFNKAPQFEPFDIKINTETENEKNDDYKSSINGKVSKIINRIDSFDERCIDPPKIENTVELPIKKSVSSRIAMFERQVSTPSELKPKLKLRLKTKPKIIEEVLKAPPPRDINLKDNTYTLLENNELNDCKDSNKKVPQGKDYLKVDNDSSLVYEDIVHVAKIVQVQDLKAESEQEDSVFYVENNINTQHDHFNERELIIDDNNLPIKVEDDVISNEIQATGLKIDSVKHLLQEKQLLPKQEKEVLVSKIKERLQRVKSVQEEVNLKKSKSVAELDLGDAVKGKVHQMIVRMKSVEHIELESKQGNINKKERPRARSVSEKIALFEKVFPAARATTKSGDMTSKELNKLVAVEMVNTTSAVAPYSLNENRTTPIRLKTTLAPPETTSDELIMQRIEGLKNARLKYGHVDNMTYVKLKNGLDMPVLALGTSLMDPRLLPHIIRAAINLGYRHIDTAYIYGNEKEVGEAIRAIIEDGTVKREDLFITGKLWSTFHRQDLVEKACAASLERMGLDYFDLYLIHNPMSLKEGDNPIPKIAGVIQFSQFDYLDAWYGMEEVYKKGLARAVGVSNFNSVEVERLVEKGKVKPLVNQVECHPYLNQQRLSQFCADRNVTIMCFGTLGSKGTPKEYRASLDSVADDPFIKVMAAGLNISVAQLLIRYQIERGHAVVTKSSSAAHLWDALQALNIKLDDTQVDALNALNKNKRTYALVGLGETHPNYPFKIPF